MFDIMQHFLTVKLPPILCLLILVKLFGKGSAVSKIMTTSVSDFTEKLDIRTILLVIYTIFIFFLLFLGYFRFKSVSMACCTPGEQETSADRVNKENLLIGLAEKQYSAVEAQKKELMGKSQAQYN